jgi:hypothetical protein
MRAYPAPFTGDGVIDSSHASDFVGIAFTGFTSVTAYHGTDATGDVVGYFSAPGTYGFNYELDLEKGLYLDTAGTGKGTVWLA